MIKSKTHHFLPTHLAPKTNQYVVLVVDDMPVNRVLLNKVFGTAGYAVVEAESGEEAIEMIEAGEVRPDVIVSDVEMPGSLDGIAFTEAVRHQNGPVANVPIIVASGNPDDAMELSAYEAGADLFMSKPFDLAALRDEVATALRREKRIQQGSGSSRSTKPELNELRTRIR